MRLSVIIPTLNESGYLAAALESIRRETVLGNSPEVIVADCGSVDGTVELARSLGARVIAEALSSRAEALNRGAALARGEVLLFLDADTVLPHGYDESIRAALDTPASVGGAFEFALDGRGFGLRLIEFINRTRYRIRPRYFSDQGIFVRAEAFHRVGGYPQRRIMEASNLCAALRREGKLVLIPKRITTSSRRFQEEGVCRVFALDVLIWWLDLIGLSTERFAEGYRGNNLARGRSARPRP